MKLRQIISGALAFAITANSMAFINSSLSASAEMREPYKGYEGEVNFDTWDGTYDTSWFTEHKGTKDDPYIIDSAEAFMGIQKKSATSGAATEKQLSISNGISWIGDLDYFSTATYSYKKKYVYAVPKDSAIQNEDSWYKFSWDKDALGYADNCSMRLAYTYDTQDITVEGNSATHHYFTSLMLDVTINGITKSIDITEQIKSLCSVEQEYDAMFSAVEDTNIRSKELTSYNHNEGDAAYLSVDALEYSLREELCAASRTNSGSAHSNSSTYYWCDDTNGDFFCDKGRRVISLCASVMEDNVYLYIPTKYDVTSNCYTLLGATDEFGITFPTITATNSSGNEVIINASNKDEFYLNVSPGIDFDNGRALAQNETEIAETEPRVSLKAASSTGAFVDTSLDDAVDRSEYSEYTSVVNMTTTDMELCQSYNSNYHYYYWQNSDSDIDFDVDPHYYYVADNWLPGYNSNILYKYSCDVTLLQNQIKMNMTCKDKDGNVVKTWTETQSFASGTYNLYNDFYIRMSYSDTTGTVTFSPYLYLSRQNASTGRYYRSSMSLSSFTDKPESVMLDDIADGIEIYDENHTKINYSDISSNLKFVGRGKDYTTHATIVSRNIYTKNVLPGLIAENDNENVTFEGKYFKLTADIEINDVYPVFPYWNDDAYGTTGMAADFDMNNHIISTNSTLFGCILDSGRLHDGIITSSLSNDTGVITSNYGEIEDISIITYNAFTKGDFSTTKNLQFMLWNYGTVKNINCIAADSVSLCNYNFGTIDTLDVLYATMGTSASHHSDTLIGTNSGLLRNVTIDTDADKLTVNHYQEVYANCGIIDAFSVKDFTIDQSNVTYKPYLYSNKSSLFESVSLLYSQINNKRIDMLPSISSSKNEITEQGVRFNNLVISGEHHNSVMNYSNSYKDYKFFNCNIDITLDKLDCSRGNFLSGTFANSKVTIKSLEESTETGRSLYYSPFVCYFVNTDISISDVCGYRNGVFAQGFLDNCNVKIGKLYGGTLFSTNRTNGIAMNNCIVEVDKAVNMVNDADTSISNGYSDDFKFYNSDFIFHSVSGIVGINYGGNYKNCRIWTNYTGELDCIDDNVDQIEIASYDDCELYFTFSETATGEIASLLTGSGMTKNTFIYVDEMPKNVCVRDASLLGFEAIISNVTIIAPGVNVHPDMKIFGILGSVHYEANYNDYDYTVSSRTAYPSENINIIADINIPDETQLKNVSAMYAYYWAHKYNSMPNIYPVFHGLNARINVYKADGSNADIPVFAISDIFGRWVDSSRINNVVFRSNSTSPYSGLFGTGASTTKSLVKDTRGAPLFWNCYMDLPNVEVNNTPSTDADYATPGFYNIAVDESWNVEDAVNIDNANRAFVSAAHYTGNIHYNRCYIPEGQSSVATYFSSDDSVTDSWNITDTWVAENLNASKGVWEAGKKFEFDKLSEGINEISADADRNGELAYMLDKGYAGVRRTYNWSVIEPNTVICNSFTNEPLYTLPEITWSSTHAIPDRCFENDANLNPVFKTTVREAQGGYIKAVGIGNTETTNGDIYVKQGAYVVEEAIPTNDEVALIYATQKLGDAVPVKIPNTPRASAYSLRARSVDNGYDITGYKQQGIDTELTPVFKTARYISVDIKNPENGTVIPSAYVSAEGEKITVSIQSETGYIVNNIKVNGQPLTESFFFMPDEDVLIAGECVPFEGGITSFSLFGIAGEIDQIAKTITVNVPKSQYINNALPVIEYYGDYIVPSTSTRTDFTSPVDYTVYYGDEQSVTYKVTVNQSEYTMKIYDFVINGVHGKIDQANKTISVGLPAETDLRSLVPEDIAYSAEIISPTVEEARDFTVDQIYTLYTTGMTPVNYVVNVYSADEDTAKLTKFVVSGYEGEIDDENLTVTLTVPKNLDLTNTVPDLIEYEGKKISPSKVAKVNLNDAEYDITSQSDIENTYTIKVNYIGDDEAHIDRFVLAGEDGVINEEKKTITVTISKNKNIIGIAPDVIEYTGKSIYPSDEKEQDFTLPVTYTVVAPDNTEVEYDIVIDWLENKADLLEFAILGYEGIINQEEKTVEVTIPYGVDITDTPPSKLVVSTNAKTDPTIIEHQDFTKPVVYTVTSQDKTVRNDYTVNVVVDYPDTTAKIYEFYIDDYKAEIEQESGVITVTLPYDYPQETLKNKIPEIVWGGKTLTPGENEAQNFTHTVKYTVAAEDSLITKDYNVVIKYEKAPYVPSKAAKITEFKIDEYEGKINDDEGVITVTLPYDYPEEELKDKVPEIEWVGKDIAPDEDTAQDFTKPVEYTVTAEDVTVVKKYDVVIEYENPDDTAKITKFKIDEYEGVIDQDKGTITIVVPYNYPDSELENKVPHIEWSGKTITPDEDEAQDFTKPLEYTVVAQNPDVSKTYDIVIKHTDKPVVPSTPTHSEHIKDKEAKIIEFWIDEYKAEIDQEKLEIIVILPHDYPEDELEHKVPKIVWTGEDIEPDDDEAQDFTKSLEYTVTAEDTSIKKTYNVIVTFTPEDEPDVEETFREDEEDKPVDEEDDTPETEDIPEIDEDTVDEEDDDDNEKENKKEDDKEEDNEEEEDDADAPVPTGVALGLVPFVVSAITVVVTGKRGKKDKDIDE